MLGLFLIGLAAAGAAVLVTVLVLLSIKWLKNYCEERLSKNKSHKVVFVDMQDIVNDEVKNKVNTAKEMSLDELERMCSEAPYVAADYDPETDTVSDYEGFRAESVEANFERRMRENDGLLVIGA